MTRDPGTHVSVQATGDTQTSSPTGFTDPRTIGDLLRRGIEFYPESVVTSYSGTGAERHTFREIGERARRLASGLAALGVGAGDRVGTVLSNTASHLECYFAVPAMGAVLHSLNFRYPADETADMLRRVGDRVLIVEEALLPLVAPALDSTGSVELLVVVGRAEDFDGQKVPGRRVLGYEDVLASGEGEFEWPRVSGEDPASIVFTSGSTGPPKGVVLSHASLTAQAVSTSGREGLRLAETETMLQLLPMFHARAWGMPYAAWFAGADLVLPGLGLYADSYGAAICRLVENARVTTSNAPLSLWTDVLRHHRATGNGLASLHRVGIASLGGGVPESLVREYDELGVEVVQLYGSTETGTALLGGPSDEERAFSIAERAQKTGRPVPGMRMRVTEPSGDELPWDGSSVGELELSASWIPDRYLDGAAQDLRDGWFRTGDLARIDSDGCVEFVDRVQNVLRRGDRWVSSTELEKVLSSHHDVADSMVVQLAAVSGTSRVVALLVPSFSDQLDLTSVKAHVRGRVTSDWEPEEWLVVDELPRNVAGMPDHRSLRANLRPSE